MDTLHTAAHWHPEGESLRCELCPHRCLIATDRAGTCGVRANRGGQLVALTYGQVTGAHLDPIEKKPLYHFLPGRQIFSVGSWGCNFKCAFCQNWQISQSQVPTQVLSPEHLAEVALRSDSIGVAYTYNEPLIWFEYVRDCAKGVRARGGKNVLVTNGYVNPAPLAELLPLINAANVDLKGADDAFYRSFCGGRLEPVLETIRALHAAGVHVEVTTLVVTGANDRLEVIRWIVDFLADLSPDIPYHLSAYRPEYKYHEPPTSGEFLLAAYNEARKRLRYVYLGNVGGSVGHDTVCPGCGKVVIERRGYATRLTGLKEGCCAGCGERVAGGWK